MRVKGQRSCEGGTSFWGNESPWTWAKNDSLGSRATRGEGARGHAPFLEASRRSWKEGGAMNREERGVGTEGYKGAQDAKSRSSWWFSQGFFVVVASSSSPSRVCCVRGWFLPGLRGVLGSVVRVES